jgi:hypothetical protein
MLLYKCVRSYVLVCIIYIPQGGWCERQGIWMIDIVEEMKLLLLLGNRQCEDVTVCRSADECVMYRQGA